ncbi:MAG: ABC transporter permease [Anaerolineae bacterium]|nr:ABC transporter permease [Anaerolineae bacterium]
MVLGVSMADYLFPEGGAVGQMVSIDAQQFVVVGVLAEVAKDGGGMILPPGAPEGLDPLGFVPRANDTVYVSYEAAHSLLDLPFTEDDKAALTTIVVEAADETEVETAIAQATAVLRTTHSLPPEAEDDFSIQSSAALAQTFSIITGALTVVFRGRIGALACLWGALAS